MTKDLVREITQLHAQVCGGLADPNRILILYTLNESSSNVSDLANTLDMSQPSVSHHLKVLKDCDMVSCERKGQSVIYQVADSRIITALDILRAVLKDSLKNNIILVHPTAAETLEEEVIIS